MKKILVLYNTQTGQLKTILDHILKDIQGKAVIDYAEIRLKQPFPFPWTSDAFFDAMPECVLGIYSEIEPLKELSAKDYDLIIYGYQPWFLSQSIPSGSFFKSEWAAVLKGKPVVTVLACRNMWLRAQETVKKELKALGAVHVGHIVFQDSHSNLVSLLTTLRWFFKGQKERSKYLPEAGVDQKDIEHARVFGPVILHHLENYLTEMMQKGLLQQKAVYINPALILLERRGVSQFPVWAKRAREKGLPGDPARQPVLKKFKRILLISIFALSPITSAGATLIALLRKKNLNRQTAYFKSTEYREGMI